MLLEIAGCTGMTLTKTIIPTRGVLGILQVGEDVLAKLTQCSGSLPATAATVFEAKGKWRWIALSEQPFPSTLAAAQ